jgi:hypothetical protein
VLAGTPAAWPSGVNPEFPVLSHIRVCSVVKLTRYREFACGATSVSEVKPLSPVRAAMWRPILGGECRCPCLVTYQFSSAFDSHCPRKGKDVLSGARNNVEQRWSSNIAELDPLSDWPGVFLPRPARPSKGAASEPARRHQPYTEFPGLKG